MRPFRGSVWGWAVISLVALNTDAHAAWNNVFQVCCHNCKSSVSAAYPVDPGPVPQQNCTTRYLQRSYYQPVVTYRVSYYQEPVTTYRTSYYWEPVVSYRYSAYYDPCSCGYQQVATPVTSYRLRSQCNPVVSYLQRACYQPVTTMEQRFYYVPETTCCNTTIGAPIAAPPPGVSPQVAVPQVPPPGVSTQAVPQAAPANPPGVSEQVAPGTGGSPPAVPPEVTTTPSSAPGNSESQKFDRLQPKPAPMPPASDGSSYRQPQPQDPTPSQPAPRVRLDRIVSLPDHNLQGQVVSSTRVPQAGARVLLVHADQQRGQQVMSTDYAGQFQAELASGTWLVYLHGADGKPVFQQKVVIEGKEPRQMTLVSR